MWIENCAADDIPKAFHHDAGPNSMLIQISDPGSWLPTPRHSFKETYAFEFLDIEDDDHADDPEMYISESQAKDLVKLLQHAYANRMNVVVHCFAGVSRSAAIAEVGIAMGFQEVEKFRSPNSRVMRLMMAELGLPYDVKQHNWREDYRKYLGAKFE